MLMRKKINGVWVNPYTDIQGQMNHKLDRLDELGFVIGELNDEVMCLNEHSSVVLSSLDVSDGVLKSVDNSIFYSLKEYEKVLCEEFAYRNLHYLATMNIFWDVYSAAGKNDAGKFLDVLKMKRDSIVSSRNGRNVGVDSESINLSALDHMINSFEEMINEVYCELDLLIDRVELYESSVDCMGVGIS